MLSLAAISRGQIRAGHESLYVLEIIGFKFQKRMRKSEGNPNAQRNPDAVHLLRIAFVLAVLVFSARSSLADPVVHTNEWTLTISTVSDTCPAVAPDGTIYFGNFVGRLWAVRPDGSVKWIFRVGLEIKSSPAIATDGTIYFGSRDRRCYALRPDGKKKWDFKTGGWVDSSPAIAQDGTIYFGSWDSNFYALRMDGVKRWQFPTGGPIVSSPAISLDGSIYFGSHDNKFYALNPDGTKKWEHTTGGPIISSPAIGEAVYFTSVDGGCYALNFDGTLRWRLRTGGVTESSPVVGQDGTVYQAVNKQLWAISPNGDKKWDRNVEDLIIPTPLVLADGSICFESGWGVMLNIAGADMNFNWWYVGVGRAPPAISPEGRIYVSQSTHFDAVQNTIPLAHSSWPKFRCNPRNTGNVRDRP
jgi:outer membrane protein assembly factor BamB